MALPAIPLAAGSLRLVQITGAALFAIVGMFQFVPGIRSRHRAWHRRAGRIVAAAGLFLANDVRGLTRPTRTWPPMKGPEPTTPGFAERVGSEAP